MRFLLSNRWGFFVAALLFGAFGIWMLMQPDLLDGVVGRLSINRRFFESVWGNVAGAILVFLAIANVVAGVLGRDNA